VANKLTVGDLEVLFTANTEDVDRAEKQIVAVGKKIESNPLKLDANAKPALASMDRVESQAKKLVSKDTALKLDADISRAEKGLERTKQRIEDLQVRALGGLDVTADVKRAEAQLSRTQRTLDGLIAARNIIEVTADTNKAEAKLDDVADAAGKAGKQGGKSLAENLDAATRGVGAKVGDVVGGDIEGTLVDALSAIPIAGGIVLAGVAIGKAVIGSIQQGLGAEVGRDRLAALTGLDEASATRLARAAGEAYADNFGESIEANMDTTRLALQFDILDEDATTRDAQLVVEGLAGIADVLGEEVGPTAQAVASMLSTGVAKSAQDAFDILAAGARNGVNRSEDLLDTFTEYPALFERLGLSGEEAMGLINQGLEGGARNSDLAADALKEFQIRATDGSTASADAFKQLGFDAEDMTAKIARGGKDARDGLAEVLDRLRETEDPVLRNAAAVGLFGTQAEDLGEALFAMDLSTAVDELGQVTGAAKTMFDTLASNDASKLETAQRNVEVAMQGIQAALATALSEPLGEAADWVSRNRGPLLQFFTDLINGAFDFGISASESFGAFVSGPLADTVEGLAGVIDFFNGLEGRPKELDDLAGSMRGFDKTTDKAVEQLEGMRDEFNGFAEGQVALGYLNDAALRTADSIAKVGTKSDGTTASQEEMEGQVRDALAALEDEIDTASRAGESQKNLTDRYNTTRGALKDQMVQAGLTEEQAQDLIDTVLKTPASKSTTFNTNASTTKGGVDKLTGAVKGVPGSKKTSFSSNVGFAQGAVTNLAKRIQRLPDGSFVVSANTGPAYDAVSRTIANINGRQATFRVVADTSSAKVGNYVLTSGWERGGIAVPMANGGTLTPMQPIAQAVDPNTWRVVGDRMKDREFYIPDDGSRRSRAVLLEAMQSFGFLPMADGGALGVGSAERVSGAGRSPLAGGLSIGTLVAGGASADQIMDALAWEIKLAGG